MFHSANSKPTSQGGYRLSTATVSAERKNQNRSNLQTLLSAPIVHSNYACELSPGISSNMVKLTQVLNSLFRDAYLRLCYAARAYFPCSIIGVKNHLQILDDGYVEILCSGMVGFPFNDVYN